MQMSNRPKCAVSALIEDNGKGFDPDAKDEVQNADEDTEDVVETNHHFGLMGMQERAKIIGAELNITSVIGEGTRVHLRVPLHEPVQEAKDVKVVKTPAKKKGKGR